MTISLVVYAEALLFVFNTEAKLSQGFVVVEKIKCPRR